MQDTQFDEKIDVLLKQQRSIKLEEQKNPEDPSKSKGAIPKCTAKEKGEIKSETKDMENEKEGHKEDSKFDSRSDPRSDPNNYTRQGENSDFYQQSNPDNYRGREGFSSQWNVPMPTGRQKVSL